MAGTRGRGTGTGTGTSSGRVSGSVTSGGDLVTTFGRLVEAHRRLDAGLAADLDGAGMAASEFEVLLRLSRSAGGRLTMGELTAALGLTTGGVTRLVDRLAAAGDVERAPCPTDRRVVYAVITPAGRTRLRPVLAAHRRTLAHLFEGWSPRDLEAFDALLDRLRP